MTQAVRNAGIVALLLLAGACVQVGHIQQTNPVRSLSFTGSAKNVAQCIQQRFQAKVMEESLANRYVIYDTVRGNYATDGITHYSITVTQTGPNQGTAEWRVLDDGTKSRPPSGMPTEELPQGTVQKYWPPVEACAAKAAKGTS